MILRSTLSDLVIATSQIDDSAKSDRRDINKKVNIFPLSILFDFIQSYFPFLTSPLSCPNEQENYPTYKLFADSYFHLIFIFVSLVASRAYKLLASRGCDLSIAKNHR